MRKSNKSIDIFSDSQNNSNTNNNNVKINYSEPLGLQHYSAPFKVYAYFFKQAILILDAIFDTILYMPFRIIFNVLKTILGIGNNNIMQIQIDLIHLSLLVSVILILNCNRFFELSLWFHNIRGQSQIKLYGIIQILDLFDRSACNQGDYILRKLYYTQIEREKRIFNRYLLYTFIYLFVHSCILGLSFTVYTVIFCSGINLLYLAIFVLSLIKLKGSIFKKQDESTCQQMLITDGREFYQKILHISLISFTVKFVPDDFLMKLSVYLIVDVIVESFKYTQIVYLNNLSNRFFDKMSNELSDLSYALTLNKEYIGQNMSMIDQKNLSLVMANIPQNSLKIMGKLQFVVFPYIILIFYACIYKLKRTYHLFEMIDIILITGFLFMISLIIKSLNLFFQKHSNLYRNEKQDVQRIRKNTN